MDEGPRFTVSFSLVVGRKIVEVVYNGPELEIYLL